MRIFCVGGVLITLLVMAGCFVGGFDESGLAGTWIADHERGVDVLVLASDHSYIHYCLRIGGIASYEGTWELYQPDYGDQLKLRDFRFTYSKEACSSVGSTELLPIGSILGQVRITVNDDFGMVFHKNDKVQPDSQRYWDSVAESRGLH